MRRFARPTLPKPWQQPLGIVLVALGALFFPLYHGNDADIDALANALAFAALALGLNIVVGFAGLLDLGYAAFFAIGAYTYGILSSFQLQPAWSDSWNLLQSLGLVTRIAGGGDVGVVHFTLSFWLALPLAAIVAAAAGALLGLPTLRLRGDYLAIVTLGFGEIVPIVFRNWSGLTGGAAGLNGIAAPRLFGWRFGVNATPYYYVALALVALLLFVSARLRDLRVGRAWMAIREDEIAAGAMGVNRTRYKLSAFAMGAAFAGMTGVLYVAKLQTATPDMFGFPVSVMILVMVVLGGVGSIWGVVVGAMVLQLLQAWWLEDLTGWLNAAGRVVGSAWLAQVDLVPASELLFGIILVGMMLFRREGLLPARSARSKPGLEPAATVMASGQDSIVARREQGDADGVALAIRGVTVRFGGLRALNAVDMEVAQGGIVAVIGPNGSGKSTLFNVITGLLGAEAGSIRFRGTDILGLPDHVIAAKGIARTFQSIRLFANLSVIQNVLIGQHVRLRTGTIAAICRPSWSRREENGAQAWAKELLSRFGTRLTPLLDQPVSRLSYANRRRTEIARALASRPKLLLLDEPTAGMNPTETVELAEQIKTWNAGGLTVLLIEHKLDFVSRLADLVYVLDHGEVIAKGRPEDVRQNEEVLRAYLGRQTRGNAVPALGDVR